KACYKLGEVYLKLNQGRDAFEFFSRAATINPDNLEAQLKTGQILLLAKKTGEAKKKAELILQKAPEDIPALILLSAAQVQEKDIDTALKTLKRAASIEPENAKIHLSMGQLYMLKKDFSNARKQYETAKKLSPTSPAPYQNLSLVYRIQGKPDQAESELKQMVRVSGNDYRNLYVLARFYENRKKWDQAEKIYIQAANSAPSEDVTPLITLGNYYTRRKAYDKAMAVMQKAVSIKKDDPNILVAIARIYLISNQLDKAGDILDKVLKKDKQHVEANFLKARMYLLKKDFDKALPLFELTARERPQSAMVHYFKGLCLLGQGQNRRAREDLLKAVELDPGLKDARLILADLFLQERNTELSGQQINAVLEQDPTNIRALMLLGNAKTLEKNMDAAEAAYKKVIAGAPGYAPGYFRLGFLYNLMKRENRALENLTKVLELDPTQMDALALAVQIYIKERKYDHACRICKKLKEKAGLNSAHLATIEYLEGKICLAKKELEKARQHFEKSIATNANILAPYVALARLYVKQNNIQGAVSQYEALLKKDPHSLVGYMGLGTIYDEQGDTQKAEANYRKALEVKPNFAPAANNLAWSLMKRGGNIDEALGFAQIAKEQMPGNPSVMDTLGWIYYHKGSYLNAIAELQDSLERNPDNAVINYHLGMAYFKNSQPDAAKEFLEKALKIDQAFEGSEKARRVLRKIGASSENRTVTGG
ncbi:MAG: hypothetical protein DRH37_03975, partial [Deltaproteobacteria bacterium]